MLLIKRVFLCTETSAGVRSDTEVANYSVNSGTIPLMSKILFRANKSNDIVNYRIAEDASGNYTSLGYTMISFSNNRMPFINTASGLRIGGLSTVGYNTSDLVFQGNFIDQIYIYTSDHDIENATLKNPIILTDDWKILDEIPLGKDQLIMAEKGVECLLEL